MNICLNNQENEICSKLKKENERRENLLKMTSLVTQPQETPSIQETTSLKTPKPCLNTKSNSFMSSEKLVNNKSKIEELPLVRHSASNRRLVKSKTSINLTRTKSAISIDDMKSLESIEEQIDRHLKELESKKNSLKQEKYNSDGGDDDEDNADDDGDCFESLKYLSEDQKSVWPTNVDNNPSAIYRMKKLEEMQRIQSQNSRKSSKSSTIQISRINSVKINDTRSDYAFKLNKPTAHQSNQNKTNADIESCVKPLLNRSVTSINSNQNYVNIVNNDQNQEEDELTTDINKIRMEISDEINQIISISPITRVKSVAFKNEETKFNDFKTNIEKKYAQQNDRLKSQGSQIKSRSLQSYSNSLPSSASNKLLQRKFTQPKNDQNDSFEFEKSIIQLKSESFNSLNKSQFKSSFRPRKDHNLNKNIFDLIRVDGKSYSAIADNIETSDVIYFLLIL